jgi:transcriptional regulator with XRE-family HTH domain
LHQRELAVKLGVAPSTITNWEPEGTIMPHRLSAPHRHVSRIT